MITEFTYDDSDRLTSVKDAEGNVTSYGYDLNGRPSSITWADGKTVSRVYDDSDNLVESVDPNGTIINQTFDAGDRLVRKDFQKGLGIGGPDHETFALDDLGRVISAENGSTTTAFKYDSLDRTLSETLTLATTSYPVLHEYDLSGNPTALTYPSGRKLAFEYDPLNRVSRITENGSPIASYTCAGTRPASRTLGNNLIETMTYDSNRRITDIVQGLPGQPPAEHLSYGWTSTRRKTSAGRTSLGLANTFGYDSALRLIEEKIGLPLTDLNATPAATVAYSVDGVDKIEAVTDSRSGVTSAAFDDRHRITSLGGQGYGYDAAGNLIRKSGGDSLTYDAENRLTQILHADGSKDEFTYDALGRRIERSTTIGSDTATTTEVESGYQVIGEYKNGQLDREYVWGNGSDELAQIKRDSDGDDTLDQVLYPLRDTQGSITALTDTSGNAVERYAYEAYGKASILAPDNSPRTFSLFGNAYLWQGRPWTGGYGYFRARYFDPASRTWTTPDPLQYSSPTANLYAGFNLDGGINGTDPLGAVYNEGMDKDFRSQKLGIYAPSADTSPLLDFLTEVVEDPGATQHSLRAQAGLELRHHIFINGIRNDPTQARQSAEEIEKFYPRDSVEYVHNPSFGVGADITQCAVNKLMPCGSSQARLEAAVAAQFAILQKARYVVVHAHSQGGIIAVNALGLLPRSFRRRTVLFTYGGGNMTRPGWLKLFHGFANWDDPVALVSNLGFLPLGKEFDPTFTIRSSPHLLELLRKGHPPLLSVHQEHGFREAYEWAIREGRQLLDARFGSR